MDKLTSILAVVSDAAHSASLLDKAGYLARCFDARVAMLEATTSDAILERLARQPVDLVIKQPASEHPLRRWTFAASDRRLVEQSQVPILLAGAHPWSRPPRFAATVDVSDRDSEALTRAILQSSGFLALGTSAHLDVLYAEREQRDERLRMERAVKLAALVREFRVGGENLQLLDGTPEKKLPPVLTSRQYDLVVLGGATRRSGLAGVLRSLSANLAEAAGGDVLLVNSADGKPVPADSPRSTGDQALDEREQLA